MNNIDCWKPWSALASEASRPTRKDLGPRLFLGSRLGGDGREIFQGDGYANQLVAVAINDGVARRLADADKLNQTLRAALQLIDDYYQTGGDLMSHVSHIAQEALAKE